MCLYSEHSNSTLQCREGSLSKDIAKWTEARVTWNVESSETLFPCQKNRNEYIHECMKCLHGDALVPNPIGVLRSIVRSKHEPSFQLDTRQLDPEKYNSPLKKQWNRFLVRLFSLKTVHDHSSLRVDPGPQNPPTCNLWIVIFRTYLVSMVSGQGRGSFSLCKVLVHSLSRRWWFPLVL